MTLSGFRALFLIALAIIVAGIAPVYSQVKCLPDARRDEVRKQILGGAEQAANAALGKELTEMRTALAATDSTRKPSDPALRARKDEFTARVCSILNTHGWPMRSSIGEEGSEAFLYVITMAMPLQKQGELYPLVTAAYEKGEAKGGDILASYVDGLRLALGRKQLYGSHVYDGGDFLVMPPLEQPAEVDKRRAAFGLPPLRTYERAVESIYRKPLIRSVEPLRASLAVARERPAETEAAGSSSVILSEEEPIRVDTAFVSVDVIVPERPVDSPPLTKADFRVFDNGEAVEIETFAHADAPFDIILLLDLSTSTSDKTGLIRKTTRRFIEMKRPGDRVGIVAFHDLQIIVSELEEDNSILLKSLKNIEGRGASYVWDSLKFGIKMLERSSPKERRKAIVLMSDGVDNALGYTGRLGSKTSFAEIVEEVQRSNAAIFPIYLNTAGPSQHAKIVYEQARKTLAFLADQSAGKMYRAEEIEDLSTVYGRVLKDVGTVYTLGFTPDIKPGDPEFRALRVELASRPDSNLKHRPGYFVR